MASGNSQTKTSHDQSKKTSETTHENQSKDQFSKSRSKRSFFSFHGIPVRSNFHPHSSAQSSLTPRSYARPFDEFAINPSSTDASTGTINTLDKSKSSSTTTKP